ncbi:dTDP-4-dehydrorhamnose reductase [Porticoccaceae bacterium]|nr:dTDP-4-dehydrorhamnose reductase [Porticoccaceae bacterium]
MKVLVLGKNGQLGHCLQDQLRSSRHEVIFTSRGDIDIGEFAQVSERMLEIKPDVVINAAAYTAVDKAESEPKLANHLNYLAVENLAKICSSLNAIMIHFSTDYVFDGESRVAYKEDAAVNPQGVYGTTKLMGELAIKNAGCKYLILRTSWVFSEYGSNFLKTMLRLGSEKDEINVVDDQIGCPTYAQDIAHAISVILSSDELDESKFGVFHFVGDNPCSWYEFASNVFTQASILGLKTPSILKPIKTINYPTPAVRPQYSVLDTSKIEKAFELRNSNWNDGIGRVLDKLVC